MQSTTGLPHSVKSAVCIEYREIVISGEDSTPTNDSRVSGVKTTKEDIALQEIT
jgi:hypothetical protein